MPSWLDRMPASAIDPDAFLYMGADPAWTPERETKLPDAPDAAAGLCSLCGGDEPALGAVDDDESGVVLAILPGSHRVCARCFRSGRDPRSKPAPGLPEPSPEAGLPVASDPGYVTRNGVTVPERFSRLMKG